eukprot:gnl/Trimastix_PCT/363.p2 GENE.gnl/Trimastix_PCT/363~~gnl/Trimastix_PCT/363.p2  ORF type:complete len:341 (+),score=94.55 gnl/Trimastix_PCT/363:63-1085(+)
MSSSLEGAIFGIGNPLLDICAVVPQDFLNKYDLALNRQYIGDAKHEPMFRELVEHFQVKYCPGGACQNTIRGIQSVLRTPNVTTFTGCVGRDQFATQMETLASQYGVNVKYMTVDDTQTGTCAALVNDGERSLVANLGASQKFDVKHLQTPEMTALIEKARVFYACSFFLMISMDSLLLMARNALANDKYFMLNISATFVLESNFAELQQIMPYVDILFGNEDEALALARAYGWEETEVAAIVRRAASLPKNGSRPRLVCITQGTSPTLVFQQGDAETRSFPVDVCPREELVDTNGAGDAFVGGFLSYFIQGKTIAECVESGHRLSGYCVRHEGCCFPEA